MLKDTGFAGDVAGDVFDGVFLCCPFFPRDVLDEIWDLTESVSGSFGDLRCGALLVMVIHVIYKYENR